MKLAIAGVAAALLRAVARDSERRMLLRGVYRQGGTT